MAAPSDARDRILDSYEAVLIGSGERAATLETVAREAGVSKGGLLYHFASKDALTDGMLQRMRALAAADVVKVRTAPEGAVRYFLHSSVSSGSPLDRAILATTRLTQSRNASAREALSAIQSDWHAAILDAVGDPTVARAVMLLSDGIYFNSALLAGTFGAAGPTDPEELDRLLDLVDALIRDRRKD